MRILIAEDEVVSRRLLQYAVEACGHACTVTEDGTAAWEVFQHGGVDVLITDWIMPLMSGLELCQKVRAHPTENYTYIILLTALDDKAHLLEGMEAGADDYLGKPFDVDELRARLLAAARVTALHHRLAQQNAELEALNQALAERSRTDPLTGLGNRVRLQEDLDVIRGQIERYGMRYAVAICDVDYFKAYNDHYGHLAGDEALRAVAQTIATSCRSGDRAYRYGGEEFVILLPAPDTTAAAAALNRVRRNVQALAIPHAGNPPLGVLTISGGVAMATRGAAVSSDEMLAEADTALYQAKDAGRNAVVVYQDQESTPQPS
jgi:diguanylate cyclase (GGDEF)-like protein